MGGKLAGSIGDGVGECGVICSGGPAGAFCQPCAAASLIWKRLPVGDLEAPRSD
jgi:hypothetical protein